MLLLSQWHKCSRPPLGRAGGVGRISSVFLFVFCYVLLFPPRSCLCLARESITILSPHQQVFAGQPLLFELDIQGTAPIREAIIQYRPLGIRRYRKIHLTAKSQRFFSGSLASQKVIPPGLEYFVVVTDKAGRIYTFPGENAAQEPVRLAVALDDRPPEIVDCEPENGGTVGEVSRQIKIRFLDRESGVDPDSIRVLLDDTDVTSLCTLSSTGIRYVPGPATAVGPHKVTITLADRFGNRIEPYSSGFVYQPADKKSKRMTLLLVDAEGRVKVLSGDGTSEPAWNLQASAGLDGTLDRGGFHQTFNGEGWYTEGDRRDTPDDPFNLSRIHYEMRYRNMEAAFGDVTVKGTDMTGRRISRRGSRAGVEFGRLSGEAFLLNSHQNTGFDDIVGGFNRDQRLVGGWIESRLLGRETLNVRATYVSGRNADPQQSYNVSTVEGGSEGDIFSMLLASAPFADDRLRLEGEFCFSDFDIDVSDDQGRVGDSGWRLTAMGRQGFYDWRLDYRNLGPYFRNIIRPIEASGREEYRFQGGLRALSSRFNLTLQHSRDKVANSSGMPVFSSTTAALAYSLLLPDFPQFYGTTTFTSQHSSREPAGFPAFANNQYTLGGGFTLQRNTWFISPNMTCIQVDDRGEASDNDSRTMVFSVAGSYYPAAWLSLTPTMFFSTTSSDATDIRYDTYQGTLSGVVRFLSDRASLSTTLSYTDNRADDRSSHTSVWSGLAQLDWDLELPLPEKMRKTIGIRGRYEDSTDHVTGDSTEDWAVYLVVSIGLPIALW